VTNGFNATLKVTRRRKKFNGLHRYCKASLGRRNS
jgi:hypothetical protein